MRIVCLGGGPAGLYFGLLMKKQDPSHDITIVERNAPGETFGWGVVFSDETLGYLEKNDRETHEEITRTFAHWDAIEVKYRGQVVRSGGHGFSGISRRVLLQILQKRCASLGVKLEFRTEVEDVTLYAGADLIVAGDGLNSKIRRAFADTFRPSLDVRKSKYIWLGTRKLFDAFTFIFEENAHGLFQVHAYRFDPETSTFIVECDEESWRKAGLASATTEETLAYLEKLFAAHLDGEKLLSNNASWINFTTVKNACWRKDNIVLVGDAAHTAHFSIGSGTKLAMEDAIALADACKRHKNPAVAIEVYEHERRPMVERIQKAAQDSLVWFENAKRYARFDPIPFAFSLVSRSKKIGYDNLKLRDPAFGAEVTREFASHCPGTPPGTPPMFTPLRLRGLTLMNRVVVSPMCMYSAEDGTVNDFHLVHLGSRAMGGAGLVSTEMTDVSRDGRITPGCAGMYKPEHVVAWRRIVDFVHARSHAAISIQLAHAGRKGSTKVMWEGMDEPLAEGNWPLISASPIAYGPENQVPREMDRDDMDRVKADFVRSVGMAEEAGFDMLEVHMAHGYLLACFLSPLTNVRTDAYGGSLENRMRYPLEVFAAMREAWPAKKPMSVRISATDWVEGGFVGEDAVVVARALKELGCDIIDVSAGQTTRDAKPVYGRMFQTPFSDQVRNEAFIPTMTVGNISSADQVNTILAARRADLCVLARPHLKNPNWTLFAAEEQGYFELPWPDMYSAVKPPRPYNERGSALPGTRPTKT